MADKKAAASQATAVASTKKVYEARVVARRTRKYGDTFLLQFTSALNDTWPCLAPTISWDNFRFIKPGDVAWNYISVRENVDKALEMFTVGSKR